MRWGILLYIDPGTGSMLFTVLLGVVGTAIFFARKLMLNIKFKLKGGIAKADNEEKVSYAIFSDNKRYWNVFKPICDEFERRKTAAVYMTASPDDPALVEKYEHVKCEFIGEGNKAFAKLNFLKADICLSTTPGLNVYQWRRSRDVNTYVHILHAVDGVLLYRMFGIDFYDAVLLTGDYQVEEMREIEGMRNNRQKDYAVIGSTYMDELKKRLDAVGPVHNERKNVLLAPTWGNSGILALYGKRVIDALLKTGYKIIIRPHPQSMISEKPMMDALMKDYPESDDLEWNFDTDNFEVLRRSDVMISDYSGVIFDFTMVFEKPIIYAEYEFDPAPYDAAWIDKPLWRDEIHKELGVPLKEEQFDDLKSVIDMVINDDKYAKGRSLAREQGWMHIGESAKLAVDYLIKKKEEIGEESISDQ